MGLFAMNTFIGAGRVDNAQILHCGRGCACANGAIVTSYCAFKLGGLHHFHCGSHTEACLYTMWVPQCLNKCMCL